MILTNKQTAEAFKQVLKYFKKNKETIISGPTSEYICDNISWALTEKSFYALPSGHARYVVTELRGIIAARLKYKFSAKTWLESEGWYLSDEEMYQWRCMWLEKLIAEYENKCQNYCSLCTSWYLFLKISQLFEKEIQNENSS